MNELFYWMNDFSFSEKTNKIDGKLTIILRSKFFDWLKKTYEMGQPRTMNEQWKNNKRKKWKEVEHAHLYPCIHRRALQQIPTLIWKERENHKFLTRKQLPQFICSLTQTYGEIERICKPTNGRLQILFIE